MHCSRMGSLLGSGEMKNLKRGKWDKKKETFRAGKHLSDSVKLLAKIIDQSALCSSNLLSYMLFYNNIASPTMSFSLVHWPVYCEVFTLW